MADRLSANYRRALRIGISDHVFIQTIELIKRPTADAANQNIAGRFG